jgi:hypothetical protein
MNKFIRNTLLAFMAVSMTAMSIVGMGGTIASAVANPLDTTCSDTTLSDSDICKNRADKLFGPGSIWTNIINTMIYVVGAVAVLMIVVGGLRYVLSGGDASQTKSAKDTILYSIIGVIIAIMAFAIVNFVLINI